MRSFTRFFPLTFALTLLLLLVLSPAGFGQLHRHAPAADPSAAFTVTGTVIDFAASYGAGMPSLIVDDPALGRVELGLGPFWYLQQEGFSAHAGDEVEALAYPCATCFVTSVAARVENFTTGAFVELRDDDGYPLWLAAGGGGYGGHPACAAAGGGKSGHHGGQTGMPGSGGNGNGEGNGNGQAGGMGTGNGPGAGPGSNEAGGAGGQCAWSLPDMSAVTTVSGTVVSVTAVPGGGPASLVLDGPSGEIELRLSPYWPIPAAGLLIEEGMLLDVTYAPWVTSSGEVLVVVAIADPATGLTVQLRDPETGAALGSAAGYGWGHGHAEP